MRKTPIHGRTHSRRRSWTISPVALVTVVIVSLATTTFARPASPPTSPLTLKQAIELVLENNAELKAAKFEIRAADVSRTHAGKLQNPRLSLVVEDFLGNGVLSGFSSAQTTLSVSQRLELGGQRGARTAVADAALLAARAAYDIRSAHLVTETVVRFLHVVADQHRLAIVARATELAKQGLVFATRRVRSGAASTVEQHRANIALARIELDAEHAEHELRASKRRLSALWGDSDAAFGTAVAQLFAPGNVLTYEALAARIENNRELIRLGQEAAVQSSRLTLAKSEAIPDLTVTLGGRRAERPDAFSVLVGVSVPLPLFQRNQAAIGIAKWKHSELVARKDAKRMRLLAGLYGDTQELAHATLRLAMLHQKILPEAESVLRLITRGFKFGRFSQIELLDAQRTLVELSRERIEAAERVWTLRVRIGRIVGTAVPSGASKTGENGE